MVGTILFRMILGELCKVFLMSLIGITGILLMAGIIAEASQQGLSPSQILEAIPLLIPSTLPYTIPATTLFASCVVYGRLSGDNEILAIKAAGVNVIKVVRPGIILGLVMSAVTMCLYYELIPSTHRLLRDMVFNDAEELLYSLLRKQQMIQSAQLPYSMFVKGVQGKKLISPVLKQKNKVTGDIEAVASARDAEMKVQMGADKPPQLLVHMRVGVVVGADGSHAYFEDRVFEVELPREQEKDRRPRDMTWNEIREKKKEFEDEIKKIDDEVATYTARFLLAQLPQNLQNHIDNLQAKKKVLAQMALHLDVEMLMRPALSAGCLCFILVGCPVGIWFSRSDYLSSFITCFLPIVLVYYPLMLCGTNMAKEGRFHPAILVFSADLVIGLAGAFLFRKLLRN